MPINDSKVKDCKFEFAIFFSAIILTFILVKVKELVIPEVFLADNLQR